VIKKIKLSIEALKPGESLTQKNQQLICFKNETHCFYRFFAAGTPLEHQTALKKIGIRKTLAPFDSPKGQAE